MEVLLNASKSLTPLPKTLTPKKPQPIRTSFFTKGGAGGAALASLFTTNGGLALTYEEALNQTLTPSPSQPFDLGSFLQFGSDNAFLQFGSDNALAIAAGAAVIAAPVILSRVFGKKKAWGTVSAKSSYARLAEEEDAGLVDIREVRGTGEAGEEEGGGGGL